MDRLSWINILVYCNEPKDRNLLELKNPETIWKLNTNMIDSKLIPFKNVEFLVAQELLH